MQTPRKSLEGGKMIAYTYHYYCMRSWAASLMFTRIIARFGFYMYAVFPPPLRQSYSMFGWIAHTRRHAPLNPFQESTWDRKKSWRCKWGPQSWETNAGGSSKRLSLRPLASHQQQQGLDKDDCCLRQDCPCSPQSTHNYERANCSHL